MLSNFSRLTDMEQSGNEVVTVNAVYSANVFTDSGGLPGTFIGQLFLSGTATFIYMGRDTSVNPLGTYVTELSGFDFKGMLNGNSFEVKQDPVNSSMGSTTILEATFVPPIEFSVSSSLEVFGDYSFNGGPFTAAPGQVATLTAIPEPGSGALVGGTLLVVLGIGSIALRGQRRTRSRPARVRPLAV
jgi:hypothetical protein